MPPQPRGVSKDPKQPEIYFDRSQGNYWLRYSPEPFLNLEWRDIKVHLRQSLVKVDASFKVAPQGDDYDYGLTVGDRIRANLQREKAVDYAGPIAGYPIGLFIGPDGKKVLVTQEFQPIQPKRGSCDWLENYMQHLFGANHEDSDIARLGQEQIQYVLLWLKFAHESLTRHDFRPAPLLILAGESGCGKSFFQYLITRFLGGRAAKPWRYITGATDFNSDLAEAEHLYIEDEAGSTDIRARRELGDGIKQITVVEEWSVHAKGRKAVSLRTYKRASMTLNNQPERLAVLPPRDADMEDKTSLLRCYDAKPALSQDRAANQKHLEEELPALAAFCLSLKAPRSGRVKAHPRYGVASYAHPELEEMVSALTPEARLLDFIDEALFKGADDAWTGKAAELERILVSNQTFGWQAAKLMPHASSCGTLLSRLAVKFPGRFASSRSRGQAIWTITKTKE